MEVIKKKSYSITGSLTFYQHILPPLESGNYKISASQILSSKTGQIPDITYQNNHNFCVIGPRFSLNPDDISSCFPPENTLGEFANVIPHVCLSRATLPWERSAENIQINADSTDVIPWLGLLLFNEEDPTPTLQSATLLDLLSIDYQTPDHQPGKCPKNILFPNFPGTDHNELDYSENWSDPCWVIDVPLELFNKIAPSLEDLIWLGHVREIKVTDSQSNFYLNKLKRMSTETSSPKLSCVIANRLPLPGKQNSVYLISFENWGQYLPNTDASANPTIPPGITQVRLVVLKKWSFFAVSEQEDFAGYLLNLNGGLLQISPISDNNSEQDKAINNAFNMGYAAFNHHTRQGDKTVSWYKGPFLPFDSTDSISIPVPSSDSVTGYNPDTGMFDVSYAAAWQLGRLLALQNKNFAQTLYNWKRENTQEVISNFETEIIQESLNEIVDTDRDPSRQSNLKSLCNQILNKVIGTFINNQGTQEIEKKYLP